MVHWLDQFFRQRTEGIAVDAALLDELKIIDTDTHVIEPPDLWTSRVSVQRWGDLVPHVRADGEGRPAWFAGDRMLMGEAGAAYAGWTGYNPDHPPSLELADRATWDPVARLRRMDDDGIYAQVLYPNVAGFGGGKFTSVADPELMLALVRAYNDYLTDYASVSPGRFIPISAVPFWDLDAAVAEVHRVAATGHRGLIMTAQPESWGQPYLEDQHWDRLWAVAQDVDLSINFHIAAGDVSKEYMPRPGGRHAQAAARATSFFIGNGEAVVRVICGGICHRFPRLRIVSVESGVGWLPFLLEALEWQWFNCGVHLEHPEYDLTPREYFDRQVYGCFWFERESALRAIEQLGPTNLMFETDFPHPTSLSPGPASIAPPPKDYLRETFATVPDDVVRQLVQDNAAKVYRLDL